ncbi:MAG TPA: twin-arginine translocation signal domain-containing protein [Burkholderiales bacterium]
MSENKSRLSRRKFLLTVGSGGAAAAAAVVAGRQPSTPGAKDTARDASQGYKVTEHINNYYRTAKV